MTQTSKYSAERRKRNVRKAHRRVERIVALIDAMGRSDAETIAGGSRLISMLIDEAREEEAKNAVDAAIASGEVVAADDAVRAPDRLDELLEAVAAGDAVRATDILRDEWPSARPLHITRNLLAARNASPSTAPQGDRRPT